MAFQGGFGTDAEVAPGLTGLVLGSAFFKAAAPGILAAEEPMEPFRARDAVDYAVGLQAVQGGGDLVRRTFGLLTQRLHRDEVVRDAEGLFDEVRPGRALGGFRRTHGGLPEEVENVIGLKTEFLREDFFGVFAFEDALASISDCFVSLAAGHAIAAHEDLFEGFFHD